MGCAGGGHPALGVCAAVTKCSAQSDLTYSFGPRQADLPEGTSVCVAAVVVAGGGGALSACSGEPFEPEMGQ